jgi:hypothetical protein
MSVEQEEGNIVSLTGMHRFFYVISHWKHMSSKDALEVEDNQDWFDELSCEHQKDILSDKFADDYRDWLESFELFKGFLLVRWGDQS